MRRPAVSAQAAQEQRMTIRRAPQHGMTPLVLVIRSPPAIRGVTSLYGGGMASWWHRDVIAAGKLPLMLCFLAFVVTFVVTRTITRMIRDGRGPFRNQVTAGGTHIHHAVPGIILLIIGAITAIGGPGSPGWR